jgi:hypothetical protein
MSRTKPAVSRQQSLFDPKTGAFADNIRDIGGDSSELRESLKKFGWVKEFPALVDENGVVLVGHRRLKIAKEEKIEPAVKNLNLGKGDAGDAERLKLAIVSNIGSKPMTREDRKRIAEHLYGERAWTMERIAEALNVSKATISGDLRNCSTAEQSKRPKTASNPRGSGRPRGSRSTKPDLAPAAKEPPTPQSPPPVEPTPPLSPPASQMEADCGRERQFEPSPSGEEPSRWRTVPPGSPGQQREENRNLGDPLGALIAMTKQHRIGKKDLRPLLAAKPTFNHVELRDLIEGLDDLAVAWIAHEHHEQQRKPAPPADDLDGGPSFPDRRTPAGGNGKATFIAE